MGLFDEAECKFPIPEFEGVDLLSLNWQTKSPPVPYMEQWEIREDGGLWHREEEREWQENEEHPLGSCSVLIDSKWVKVNWNGEFEIYAWDDKNGLWYSIQFWFRDGVVKDYIASKEPHFEPTGADNE